MVTKEMIKDVLFRSIAEALEEDIRVIEDSERLVEDLCIDSMGFLFLTVSIEREFSVKITPDEWKDILTFGELIEFVQAKTMFLEE